MKTECAIKGGILIGHPVKPLFFSIIGGDIFAFTDERNVTACKGVVCNGAYAVGHIDVNKMVALCKSTRADDLAAVGQHDIFCRDVLEGFFLHFRYTVGKGEFRQGIRVDEITDIYNLISLVRGPIRCRGACIAVEFHLAGAEGVAEARRFFAPQPDVCQLAATDKGVISDACQAFRQTDAGEVGTESKGISSNAGHAVRYDDGS